MAVFFVFSYTPFGQAAINAAFDVLRQMSAASIVFADKILLYFGAYVVAITILSWISGNVIGLCLFSFPIALQIVSLARALA